MLLWVIKSFSRRIGGAFKKIVLDRSKVYMNRCSIGTAHVKHQTLTTKQTVIGRMKGIRIRTKNKNEGFVVVVVFGAD